MDESEDDKDDDDESEEDMEGDDYMDIADMLDDNESPVMTVDKESVRTLLPGDDSDDDDLETAEFMGFSDNDDDSSADDDNDDDDNQQVVDFITSLDTKKRKRGVDKDGNKKQKPLAERSEIYKENEFNLPVQKSTTGGGKKKKLDFGDLMGSLDGEASLNSLRDTLKTMADNNKAQPTLDAPLPQRIQDRMERQAAYAEANKEVARWEPTVKENREVKIE
jgi:U3 small nucleolar RNA-associated protein 14